MDIERLLTVNQVAKRLSVDPESVRRYLRDGILQGYQVGGRWRVEPAEVDRFLESVRRPRLGG